MELIVTLKLLEIETLWREFWRSPTVDYKSYEDQLSTDKFMSLCDVEEVVEFVKHADYQFYQFCIEILIPDVIKSQLQNLVKSIRELAKCLDDWIRNAVAGVPERMKQFKLLVINTFSMQLKRYTSLNHLAQTVRNSLSNGDILRHMLKDIGKVDFNYIRVQSLFF